MLKSCFSNGVNVSEYLLTHPSQTAICITRLKVLHGDESTRLRLSRLSSTQSNVAEKLALLEQLSPASPLTDLHQLDDPSVSNSHN